MMSELCPDCSDKRWYPTLIENWEKLLENNGFEEKDYVIKKNICYNLYYLEYLDKTKNELDLSGVIITQTIKTFLITSLSIIESLFYYILVKENLIDNVEWEKEKSVKTQVFKYKEKNHKIETRIYKKLETPYEKEISFQTMIDKIFGNKIIENRGNIKKRLVELKKKRNHIHLHVKEYEYSSDWFTFDYNDYMETKEVLLYFLRKLLKFNKDEEKYLEFLSTSS